MAWYVVFVGRRPGIYEDWHACHAQVAGFSNCAHKKFKTKKEAVEAYTSFCAMAAGTKSVQDDANEKNMMKHSKNNMKDVLIGLQFLALVGIFCIWAMWPNK